MSISNVGYEAALTDFPQSVIPPRMGRPTIKRDMKVEKTTLWLHRPVVDRIIELVGKQGLSQFMREAAEAELTRRERPRPNPKTD